MSEVLAGRSAHNQLEWIKAIGLQIFAVVVIYLLPSLSHLSGLKLYLIDPMRLMVILAIAHTSRKNALLLCLTLPVFSFLISAHPVFLKSLLIAVELSIMTAIFYRLSRYFSFFSSILTAIVLSKVVYYFMKYILLQMALIKGSLVSTPLYIQAITTLVFSAYIWLIFRKTVERE